MKTWHRQGTVVERRVVHDTQKWHSMENGVGGVFSLHFTHLGLHDTSPAHLDEYANRSNSTQAELPSAKPVYIQTKLYWYLSLPAARASSPRSGIQHQNAARLQQQAPKNTLSLHEALSRKGFEWMI